MYDCSLNPCGISAWNGCPGKFHCLVSGFGSCDEQGWICSQPPRRAHRYRVKKPSPTQHERTLPSASLWRSFKVLIYSQNLLWEWWCTVVLYLVSFCIPWTLYWHTLFVPCDKILRRGLLYKRKCIIFLWMLILLLVRKGESLGW